MSKVYDSKSYSTAQDFLNHLVEQCQLATANQEYLVTAFLAFDFTNPELAEVFNNPTLWNSLDQETGDNILLYYLDFQKQVKENYKKRKESSVRKTRFPNSVVVSDVVPLYVPKEETPSSTISFLLEKLGYNDYTAPKMPFVIFLKVENDTIVNNFCYQLDYEDGFDKAAYIELCGVIKRVLAQVSSVERGDEMNYDTVFNLAVHGAKDGFIRKIKKSIRFGLKVLEVKSLICP